MTKSKIFIFVYIIVFALVLIAAKLGYDIAIPEPYRTIMYIMLIAAFGYLFIKGLKKRKGKHEA